jgi:predicted phage gp36 major capsid-like protein
MALTHDMRRALVERVQRRVEGRAIPRHLVEDAVARVGDALEPTGTAPSGTASEAIVAVFTAPSAPDLGSRVRAALHAEAIAPLGIGSSTAGRHTVATVRLASAARAAAERVATRLSASVSFVPDSSSLSSSL